MSSDRQVLYRVEDGLACFGNEAVAVINLIEALFSKLAAELGAELMLPPPLVRVDDLNRIDYFQNFPHLGSWVAPLRGEVVESYTGLETVAHIPPEDLAASHYGLPSAACYNVYIQHRDTVLDSLKVVTLTGSCFRRESHYLDLSRLWGFRMREIVCLGESAEVQRFLSQAKAGVSDLIAAVDLPIAVAVAQDPFFASDNPRLAMQKMFPTKEEFQYGETALAIASVNFHHNFFGERFDILDGSDSFVFTGCVAMGLERWLKALLERYDNDVVLIKKVLSDCA